jgi:hypothetical protein
LCSTGVVDESSIRMNEQDVGFIEGHEQGFKAVALPHIILIAQCNELPDARGHGSLKIARHAEWLLAGEDFDGDSQFSDASRRQDPTNLVKRRVGRTVVADHYLGW